MATGVGHWDWGGHWERGGHGLAPIRWVFAKAATGLHRGGDVVTTDTARAADTVGRTYCGRRGIETAFQVCRS